LEEYAFELLDLNYLRLKIQIVEQSPQSACDFKILVQYFLAFDLACNPADKLKKQNSAGSQFIYHLLKKSQIKNPQQLKMTDEQLDLVLKQRFYSQLDAIKQNCQTKDIQISSENITFLAY
jgi:hypothetical protein